MKNFKRIVIIIFCVISIKAKAQLFTWNKTIDTISNEETGDIFRKLSITKQTSDNHILYLQNVSSEFPSNSDSVIISKYTLEGNLVWKKKYPFTTFGIVNDLIETTDNNFMMVSDIGDNKSVIKLDNTGEVIFINTVQNGNSNLSIKKITPTTDGNYLLTSTLDDFTGYCYWSTVIRHTIRSTYITKIDENAHIIWDFLLNENKIRDILVNNYQEIYEPIIDFLDDGSQNFNIIYYTKEEFNQVTVQLNLSQYDKDGNLLFTTPLKELPAFYYVMFCNDERKGHTFTVTPNGYTLYTMTASNDTASGVVSRDLNKLYFNKSGVAIDSTFKNIQNDFVLSYLSYYMDNNKKNNITNKRTNSVDFIRSVNSVITYSQGDTGFVFSNSNSGDIKDETTLQMTCVFLSTIDDSTLFFISEVTTSENNKALLKFYKLSLHVNQINYFIYIDKNDNSLKDSAESSFSDALIEFNDGTTPYDLQPSAGSITKYLLAGNYTSKLISYNQTLKYYNVSPESKTTIFNTNRNGIDTITFRLTPKPNIQDLQVSIVPLIAARPGFNSFYKIIAKNVGTKIMYLPAVKFIKDSLQTFTDSTTYALVADTLFWQIDSLSLLEQREIVVSVLNAIPPTLNANDTLHLAAVIYPVENDSFVQDNYASLNQVVVNSVDPNDKIETHGGTIPYSAVQNREYLYYTIRFQNTGNSYASRIVITDTLTENLDATTFEFLSSSVPFVMNVADKKYITWTAANTYLSDSTSDEPNSHGYISFRIKPKAGLLPNDEITNRASIVFDYNAAISTNTCTTNIIEQRILSVKNNEIKSIYLFPNPTNGNVQLNMNLSQNKNYSLRIIDINGNLLLNETLKGNAGENNTSINLSSYANGLYFIQVSDETGNLFYGKVVKQ